MARKLARPARIELATARLEGGTENEDWRGFTACLSNSKQGKSPIVFAACSAVIRRIFGVFFGLLACILSACGGGSSHSQQTASPFLCDKKTVKIQLFGDSTMWGYASGGDGARASVYPELALQQLFDLKLGRGAVEVSTRAVSGTASGHLLHGSDGLNAPWPQPVAADIVVINHGINDAANGTTPEGYRANLLALSKAPALVVFQTPLPVATNPPHYDQLMREVAAQVGAPVIDARAYAQSLPDWWQFAPDGVHATSQGYEAIAKGSQFPALLPMVEKLRCGV